MFSRILHLFKTLQGRVILIVFFLFLVPSVVFMTFTTRNASRLLEQSKSELIISSLNALSEKVRNIELDMVKLTNILINDGAVHEDLVILKKGSKISPAYYKNRLNDRLSEIKTGIFFNYSLDLFVIAADGTVANSFGTLPEMKGYLEGKLKFMRMYQEQEWYRDMVAADSRTLWISPFRYDIEGPAGEENYVSLIRTIPDPNSRSSNLGIIVVNINASNINDLIEDVFQGEIFVLNRNYDLIYSSGKTEIPATLEQKVKNIDKMEGYLVPLVDNRRYLVPYKEIERNGWVLLNYLPYTDFNREVNLFQRSIFGMGIVLSVLTVSVFIFLLFFITRPLNTLLNKIREFRLKNRSVDTRDIQETDDMRQLVRSVDTLFERIRALSVQVVQEQRLEYEMKYASLAAQIQPHFLLNTLEMIRWSALMSGADNIAMVLSRLGRLINAAVKFGEDEVTIREELEIVKAYIELCEFSLNYDVNLEIKDSGGLVETRIKKFFLQPIVENCILHGTDKDFPQLNIIISLKTEGDTLIIAISDNGKGYNRENLEMTGNKKIRSSGIALENIRQRIALHYGEEYGVDIEFSEGRGTTVVLCLPLIKGPVSSGDLNPVERND